MRVKLIILLLCFPVISRAQSLERSVVGSTGSYETISWGSVSFTVGEVVVTTAETPQVVLTQGFQQTVWRDSTGGTELLPSVRVQVFPNPTTGLVNIRSTSPVRKVLVAEMGGKTVIEKENNDPVDLTHLDAGVYVFTVLTSGGVYHTRIVKK